MLDKTHGKRTSPKKKGVFDNNYLYYLYCKGNSEGNYDEAMIYLRENISQIVYSCKSGIVIPYHMHDDINVEMMIVADGLYRSIFEDESLYDYKDKKGNFVIDEEGKPSKTTKFYKYYQPSQVYGYLRVVVRGRIINYFNKNRDDEDRLDKSDMPQMIHDELDNRIGSEMVMNRLLSSIVGLEPVDEFIFSLVGIQEKSYKQTSELLLSAGIDMSVYQIKKRYKSIIEKLKENVGEIDLSDIIIY